MSDTIITERDFHTNGIRIPAGKLSTDDLRDLLTVPAGKGAPRHITEEEAKDVQQDLLRRQGRYQQYTKGITERHEVIGNGGTMAVGGGADA